MTSHNSSIPQDMQLWWWGHTAHCAMLSTALGCCPAAALCSCTVCAAACQAVRVVAAVGCWQRTSAAAMPRSSSLACAVSLSTSCWASICTSSPHGSATHHARHMDSENSRTLQAGHFFADTMSGQRDKTRGNVTRGWLAHTSCAAMHFMCCQRYMQRQVSPS